MLKQSVKERLKQLGIDADKLIEAAKADTEQDFALPEGSLLTEAQLTERDNNTKTIGVSEGESKAINLAKQEFKKRGLELKGERWGDLVNEVNTLINKDKDTKIQQLQEQNTALLIDVESYKTKVTDAEARIGKAEFEFSIMSSLPSNNLGLNPKETLEVLRMRGYEPVKTDTGVIWNKGGQPLKDSATHAPLTGEKAVQTIYSEMKWNTSGSQQTVAGRNITTTGAAKTGSFANITEATKAFSEAHPGKNKLSPEYTAFIEQAAKDNPAFSYVPAGQEATA